MQRSAIAVPLEASLSDPYTVTVVSGEAVRVERNGSEIELEQFLPATVEDLFGVVEDAAFADELDVNYHPILGYPRQIVVDPVLRAVDEEYQIDVVELVID